MLVLRPADAEETIQAWKLAMENTSTPTALILFKTKHCQSSGWNRLCTNCKRRIYVIAGSDPNP